MSMCEMRTLRDRAPDPPEGPDSPVPDNGLEDRLTPERPASHRRESPEETRRVGLGLILGVLGVAVVLSVTLAITIGPVYISPITVWQIILSHIFGTSPGDWTAGQDHIVWLIRLPRVLLAGVVGAGLAVVGVAMQATVRNPLADPYLLGTSSGASVGAVLVIMLGINFLAPYSLSILAFVGAVGSFAIVFAVSQTGGRVSPTRLILAGVATAYVLTAITSMILFLGDERAVRTVLFWMLGTLSGAEWSFLGLPAAALLLGISILILKYRAMNALLAGEETAITLGVDTQGLRRQLLVLTALITGVMVAVSGAIGFVGLMMPHIVRLVVGADHRIVLPTSALTGAIFLIWVDVAARTVVQPQEIPVSVITALVGAPFFLWLLRWRRQAYGGQI